MKLVPPSSTRSYLRPVNRPGVKLVALVGIAKVLVGCSGITESEPSPQEQPNEMARLCLEYCRAHYEVAERTACTSDLEGCNEACRTWPGLEEPCVKEGLLEFICAAREGVEFSCEIISDTGLLVYDSIGACEDENEALRACECATYCGCGEREECQPPESKENSL